MKYFWQSFLILLIFCSTFFAQKQKKSIAKHSKVEAELMQLERDIGQANIRRDKSFFERVEADEFIFTDSGGGITTKAEDVASLDKPAGDFKLVSYEVDEMKISIYGKTAVVTGRTFHAEKIAKSRAKADLPTFLSSAPDAGKSSPDIPHASANRKIINFAVKFQK